MLDRRTFLKTSAAAATFLAMRRRAYAFNQSPLIGKFQVPLPGLGASGIPVATPISASNAPVDIYNLEVRQFTQQILPTSFGPTTFWGYVDAANKTVSANPRYLGPVIVAKKDKPVQLIVTNQLPGKHILPVDTSIMGAEPGQLENRVTVHLHGALVPWHMDGNPFSWFSPGPWGSGPSSKQIGGSFLNGTGVAGQASYYYPNNQSARMMWYHDHTMGLTRLNAYAGLASAYLIQDDFEAFLIKLGVIPATQIPLVIQDKSFKLDGSLWYPDKYEGPPAQAIPNFPDSLTQDEVNKLRGQTGRWDRDETILKQPPNISAVAEFFADTILVNGAPYPFANVPAAPIRFRVLNGSQARFYNLQLYYESLSNPGEADLKLPGPAMIQIGTEGGFLFLPALLNNPPKQIGFDTNPASPTFGNANRYNLLLAPAERADIIIDFTAAAGRNLILYNDAPSPFPGGDPRNDYFTGDLDMTPVGGAPATLATLGPNTRTLMKITVGTHANSSITAPPLSSSALLAALAQQLTSTASQLTQSSAFRVRDLTLNEDFDEFGRLIQMLGTNVKKAGSSSFSRGYMDPATETPHAGDTEIWRIFNLTMDTHPMHFHLVNVQVLGRQAFDAANYNGNPKFIGSFRGPDPNELGPKETVRMNPGEMTMVIMKFDLPKVPFKVPVSPRTGGYEYVWHCHILEHEEHDMMRPLVVLP